MTRILICHRGTRDATVLNCILAAIVACTEEYPVDLLEVSDGERERGVKQWLKQQAIPSAETLVLVDLTR